MAHFMDPQNDARSRVYDFLNFTPPVQGPQAPPSMGDRGQFRDTAYNFANNFNQAPGPSNISAMGNTIGNEAQIAAMNPYYDQQMAALQGNQFTASGPQPLGGQRPGMMGGQYPGMMGQSPGKGGMPGQMGGYGGRPEGYGTPGSYGGRPGGMGGRPGGMGGYGGRPGGYGNPGGYGGGPGMMGQRPGKGGQPPPINQDYTPVPNTTPLPGRDPGPGYTSPGGPSPSPDDWQRGRPYQPSFPGYQGNNPNISGLY